MAKWFKTITPEPEPTKQVIKSKCDPYFKAGHKPQSPDPSKPPRYCYRVKLRHENGTIETIVLSSYDDTRMLNQAREFADIMACKVLKVWGKHILPPLPDKPVKPPFIRKKPR